MQADFKPTTTEATAAKTIALPLIRRGDQGQTVKIAQKILIVNGYLGNESYDANFGQKTEQAVKNYQNNHNLAADGVVGMKTWEELIKDIRRS
ncbi:MAG: peptidoglycan-binding protein [Cyanomargarita calcarea GSE-NOS-MK-12-04C]|jgi:peptidoglycan hydrolase-like protein with peptidoglycan-binding domain|uniref:Peptidoglycan-binding protein n=1 Tax=Cyanomargarita calcarea GSE-NOS-MK-12-04C TaxID=2839659 RepID=A0A951UWM4_9CYAN|nr:peptidoglycan-binding protein [Cyanomargarita calcarea GSE-NOS-MK-12-04C]